MILLSPDAVEDVEPLGWVEPLRNPSHLAIVLMGLASAFALRATADKPLTHPASYANSASDSAPGWFDNRRSAGR
jgi:hypothetical protein